MKRVKRTAMLFMAAAATVAMLIASPMPAMAASPADPLIFIPVPNGAGGTYSCAEGPPFVSDLDSSEANCTRQQSGAPDGLVCDVPTTITFVPAVPEVPGVNQHDVGGLLCH